MADDEEDEDGWEIESLKYLPEEDLISFLNQTLPCEGIPDCHDGFYFLRLPTVWKTHLSSLVALAEAKFQYNKQVTASPHKLVRLLKEKGAKGIPNASEAFFFPQPSEVGPHISIEKTSANKVPFRITRWMRYANQTMGIPNRFDQKKYVAEWIALRVEWDWPENESKKHHVSQVSSPHVTIAGFGFDGKIELDNKDEKKKKKR